MCLGEEGGAVGRRDARVGGGSSPLLSACVGECCCAPGGGGFAVTPVCPGKQCPRRVFYGSCWTLISFVPHLSRAAAALSPPSPALRSPTARSSPPRRKRVPRLTPPSRKKKKPRTTRSCGRPHRCPQQASPVSPTGPSVQQINFRGKKNPTRGRSVCTRAWTIKKRNWLRINMH